MSAVLHNHAIVKAGRKLKILFFFLYYLFIKLIKNNSVSA